MEDPFRSGEKVVCISDKCRCCGEVLDPDNPPQVGEVYTVDRAGPVVDPEDGEAELMFIPLFNAFPPPFWPQYNFKRIPPQQIDKEKEDKSDLFTKVPETATP